MSANTSTSLRGLITLLALASACARAAPPPERAPIGSTQPVPGPEARAHVSDAAAGSGVAANTPESPRGDETLPLGPYRGANPFEAPPSGPPPKLAPPPARPPGTNPTPEEQKERYEREPPRDPRDTVCLGGFGFTPDDCERGHIPKRPEPKPLEATLGCEPAASEG